MRIAIANSILRGHDKGLVLSRKTKLKIRYNRARPGQGRHGAVPCNCYTVFKNIAPVSYYAGSHSQDAVGLLALPNDERETT